MRKARDAIKAKWEWVTTPDAKDRLRTAFDIIFDWTEESHVDASQPPTDQDSESGVTNGQLPLF